MKKNKKRYSILSLLFLTLIIVSFFLLKQEKKEAIIGSVLLEKSMISLKQTEQENQSSVFYVEGDREEEVPEEYKKVLPENLPDTYITIPEEKVKREGSRNTMESDKGEEQENYQIEDKTAKVTNWEILYPEIRRRGGEEEKEINRKLEEYVKGWQEEILEKKEVWGWKETDETEISYRVLWNTEKEICISFIGREWGFEEYEKEKQSKYLGKKEVYKIFESILYIELEREEIFEIVTGMTDGPNTGGEFFYGREGIVFEGEKYLEAEEKEVSYYIEKYCLRTENKQTGRDYVKLKGYEWNYFILKGEKEGLDKVNQEIEQAVERGEELDARYSAEGTYTQYISSYITYYDENLISILHEYAWIQNGVRTSIYEFALCDLNTGEKIRLEDIIKEKEELGELLDNIYRQNFLSSSYSFPEHAEVKENFKNEEEYEGGVFYLKEDRLGFECSSYDIWGKKGSLQGARMIEIPIDFLKEYQTEPPFWDYIEEVE